VFVLAEHGRSTHAVGRTVMRVIEPLCISADHITRDPASYLTSAGFTITEVQRGGPGGIVFRILAHKHDTYGDH
jgi:hypothetical protein